MRKRYSVGNDPEMTQRMELGNKELKVLNKNI